MRIFLDCDGVLADFDKKAMELLDGKRPRDFEGQEGAEALWEKLYSHENFFYSLDPMPDAMELIYGVQELGYYPTILTGLPKPIGGKGAVNADNDKRRWVQYHLGDFPVITCPSKNKCLHIENRGDVLIDDWNRYTDRWNGHGGHFILHTSASDSLDKLQTYLEKREKWIDKCRFVTEMTTDFVEKLEEGLMH